MKIKHVLTLLLAMAFAPLVAQNTECSGTSTAASEGEFTMGYTYSFETSGTDVIATFELLDPQVGLVAFAQTYNPDFAETPMSAVSGQTFTATFPGQTVGEDFNMACKFAYAGGLSTTIIYTYTVGNDCSGGSTAELQLPIDFEDETLEYGLTDFGGNASSLVEDPESAGNTVVQSIRTDQALVFAGTTVGEPDGLVNPIPFDNANTILSVRVWSPVAGVPVRLKVENAANGAVSAETETMTTMAMAWETLSFDFANVVPGTPGLNVNATYNLPTIFFNFGATGADAGEQIYYWDDVSFEGGGGLPQQLELPITFEDELADYGLADFGGTASQIIADPEDAANTVVETFRSGTAELWAGTTVGEPLGFANPIPFSAGNTQMTVRVWSPLQGIPVRLKVENASDPAMSVETEATTTTSMAWETLTFDFANEAAGTAPINFNSSYNLASIFFHFGTTGQDAGELTFYWDDVEFGGGSGTDQIDLPITFEDEAADYGLADFGGTASQIIADPEDAANAVVETFRSGTAELWAGTTVGEPFGFANPIPFSMGNTQMTVRVWSPLEGIPVRLKVEDASNPTISVETEATTTTSMAWETLTFDFDNEVAGTAAINFANSYNKASIFFYFGTTGQDAGELTFYWDDVEFGGGMGTDLIDLPITFEDEGADYGLADFGGTASQIIADPEDATNTVVETFRSGTAELWAGTTVGEPLGFANPIPFSMGNTQMTVRVWSPVEGIPVRLKVEDATDPTVSVETEATTTTSMAWETLTFDFDNEVAGTAAINFASDYTKASIFFYFGTTGQDAGELTFYWDDVEFGGGTVNLIDLPITFEDEEADYGLADFGGTASQIIADPEDATNTVVETFRSGTAELWAGTTVGEPLGFANPIPFSMGNTQMSVRVWSPVEGIPVRLKVEDATDPTVSVETEATTTTSMAWETLTFDFDNEVAGTAPINFASTYTKASIFFYFGTTGQDAGELTFYWDDVEFGAPAEPITVADIVINSPNHTNLETALITAGLVGTLQGEGPFTVFAPTDAAFANLPDGFLDIENPSTELTEVLLYHVIGSLLLEADLNEGTETTLQGETVAISFQGENILVNDVLISVTDLIADNGVVHVIDAVLLPSTVNGLEEIGAGHAISVWPNPASNLVQIDLGSLNSANTVVTLFDLTGRMINQHRPANSMLSLDVSGLNTGNYIIRIDTADKGYYSKLVISR